MTDVTLPATIAAGLTQADCEFVYNKEVLGLPTKKAASLAGVPFSRVYEPHIKQACELVQREMRGSMPSKETLVHMTMEAIDRARLLGDPMTEIIGIEKVHKMLGYDVPQKIDININASVEVLRENVRTLPTSQLIAAVPGAADVIDADFYEVGP